MYNISEHEFRIIMAEMMDCLLEEIDSDYWEM